MLDVVIASIGLAFLSPVIFVTALTVRVFDGKPVLFKQARVGLCGVTFEIFKFRTMSLSDDRTMFSANNDPRITALGSRLRKTKLDELPQLLNVLRGEMSLVGPRPEVPEFVDQWPAGPRESILSIRPGITDPASIRFRDEGALLADVEDPAFHYSSVIMPEKLRMYEEYVNTRSTIEDLRILVRTVLVGLKS